jgi:hypothetical protein
MNIEGAEQLQYSLNKTCVSKRNYHAMVNGCPSNKEQPHINIFRIALTARGIAIRVSNEWKNTF